MSEKKYVVPQGMIDAAYQYCPASFAMPAVRSMLEAALQWLAENPIVPTVEQGDSLFHSDIGIDYTKKFDATRAVVVEWQRRMFLAPESQIPEELEDLLLPRFVNALEVGVERHRTEAEYKKSVIEAFRRGQKAGS
jgi:hypothetical protein